MELREFLLKLWETYPGLSSSINKRITQIKDVNQRLKDDKYKEDHKNLEKQLEDIEKKNKSDMAIINELKKNIEIKLEELCSEIIDLDKYKVKLQDGKGGYAKVPWIEITNKAITATSTDGVYIAYFLSADLKNIIATISIGTSKYVKESKLHKKEDLKLLGFKNRTEYVKDQLEKRKEEIISIVKNYKTFKKTDENEVVGIGEDKYDMSTVCYKKYTINELKSMVDDNQLVDDLKELLYLYDYYAKNIGQMTGGNKLNDRMVHDIVSLLKSNKQIILTGSPGTGKTFLAKNHVAAELIGSDPHESQVALVQFHPSFDYTDFIEGIRPRLGSKEISYEIKNGIFKEFCRNAGVIERLIAANKELTEENIRNFAKSEKIAEFWIDAMSSFDADDLDDQNKVLENLPPFIFIIDEINRAEISKVIGEVMYSLDADYRGIKGKVYTQYASSASDKTFYVEPENDYFFIPSNVYIIGTMNDIDRSVEVFDFALRRRFAWKEIEANSVMRTVLGSMLENTIVEGVEDLVEDLAKRADALNRAIVNDLKLNPHYHLGPAYFGKIKLYSEIGYEKALNQLWDNHINQILLEYTKTRKLESTIEDIKNRFITVIKPDNKEDNKQGE